MKKSLCWLLFLSLPILSGCRQNALEAPPRGRPNILIAISDDQSWPHASAYGSKFVHTPSFDRVAAEGVLFNNAFTTSPGCAPSRASIVLGRFPWQNEHAGSHNTLWPSQYKPLPDYLREAGYHVGHTGKGVGPFQYALGGRYEDPAGTEYNGETLEPPFEYISKFDYAANFEQFLSKRNASQPFFFWYGATEPHRRYATGSGEASGKQLEEAEVPPFLPDAPDVRGDLLDYAVEIEWFDGHLGRMLQLLEETGDLENTLIIVTSDNGMPFPAAKANCYEFGTHVPLAIRWGSQVKPGRSEDSLVSLADLMPTILEAAAIHPDLQHPMASQSFLPLLRREPGAAKRDAVYFSRERHSNARWSNLGYPQRAIRTEDFLYIRNFKPERWPAGSPLKISSDGQLVPAYHDFDWGPTWGRGNRFVVEHEGQPEFRRFTEHALSRRPSEELFDIKSDPGCMRNLAADPAYAEARSQLAGRLEAYLGATRDPRVVGPDPDAFETYPRLAEMRKFPRPEWADQVAPAVLAELLSKVDSDFSPVTPPDRFGEWGLEAGAWRLEKTTDGGWHLGLREPHAEENPDRQMPQLKSQLIRVYEWFEERGGIPISN